MESLPPRSLKSKKFTASFLSEYAEAFLSYVFILVQKMDTDDQTKLWNKIPQLIILVLTMYMIILEICNLGNAARLTLLHFCRLKAESLCT